MIVAIPSRTDTGVARLPTSSFAVGRDNDAGSRRTPQTGRVPDRDGNLTGSYGAGIAEAGGGQTIGGDLDDGEIAVRVAGGDDPGELAAVVEDDVDAVVSEDVTIGDDDAIGAPDDTGTVTSALADEHDRWFDLRRDIGDRFGERQPSEGRRDRSNTCFLTFQSH